MASSSLCSSSTAQQFSISVIPVKEKNIIPDEYRNIDWALDLSMEEIEEGVSGEAQPRVSHQTSRRDIEVVFSLSIDQCFNFCHRHRKQLYIQ